VDKSKTKEGADNTIWFWDVIDEGTEFLLPCHMSHARTIKDAGLPVMPFSEMEAQPPATVQRETAGPIAP
jgi:hypothetical protein